MFGSKKKLIEANKQIEQLTKENRELRHHNEILCARSAQQKNKIEEYETLFPFKMGQVVYDVQLRSATGRFTRTKASREHSLINEVTVDKKNYFNLVERYNQKDVFVTRAGAEAQINAVCID